MASRLIETYMREERLPHIWCAGCGHGILMRDVALAIDNLTLEKKDVIVVSGIGCSSRAAGYMNFDTLHTTHGRAIAFATGIKMAKPHLKIVVITGDGDATAIGGNHLIHAARRNIDMTVVVFNNNIYGMTGGQFSPTTPTGDFATTAPYGSIDPDFDIPKLAEAAGATYTARGTAYHVPQTVKLIESAIAHEGFSLVECVSVCPTYYGRKNKKGDAVEMLKWQRDNAVPVSKARSMSAEELKGKIVYGELRAASAPSTRRNTINHRGGGRCEGVKEKKTRYEMRFAGSGGQGVILCSIILAEAAFLAGKRVAQSQSYGPEARGGLCRAELVVDENEITYPKVTQPDFLLTLTQASLDKFGANTSEDALIMIDKSLLEPDDLGSYNVVSLPILHTAARVVGKPMTANIVAVGAINELLAIAPEDTLREAVKMHIPKGTEEINMQALTEGMKLGASAKWTVTLP